MSLKTKIGLAIAAVAAAGAIIGGVAAWRHQGSSGTSSNSGGHISVGGQAGGCFAAGQGAVVNCPPPVQVSSGSADPAIEKSIAGTASPAPPGPWAFTVLYDEVGGKPLGLYIRSSPERSGFHLGLAQHLTTVWVDCVLTNRYDPDLGTGGGPRWFKVHWPNKRKSEGAFDSGPSDPAQGWAYAYYLRPNGTNGHVPACK